MPIDTIILDVQHIGKPDNPFDRGAYFEGNYEVDLALKYAICIREKFITNGFKTFLITSGRYSERHVWVNTNCDKDTSLYLACHLNMGGGRYPLIEYNYNSGKRTRAIAELLAESFNNRMIPADGCPTLSQFSNTKIFEIAYKERGWICLAGTAMSALLLEPLFLDNKAHLDLAKRPFGIASAVFDAVTEFNDI